MRYTICHMLHILAWILCLSTHPCLLRAQDTCVKDAIVYQDLNKKYLLGLKSSVYPEYILSEYQWYFAETGEPVVGQESPSLVLTKNGRYDATPFQLCFKVQDTEGNTIHEQICTCAKSIADAMAEGEYERPSFSDSARLEPTGIAFQEGRIFVNTETEATAYWFDITGQPAGNPSQVLIPAGGKSIDIPRNGPCFVLRISSAQGDRSYKIFQNR